MVLAVAISPVSMDSMPSRRSSLRNFGSRATRARMVSLKSRVRAIIVLLLSSFVVLPVLPEIDPVTRPEVDSVLEHTRTDTFDVREIAGKSGQSCLLL